MIRRRIGRIVTCLSVMALATVTNAGPAMAGAGIANSAGQASDGFPLVESAPPGYYPAAYQGPASSTATSALLGCHPISYADNPHTSAGDVSAHGLWDKGTCTANTAHVTARLYELFTNGQSTMWVLMATGGPNQLKPKVVSNNRTTVRKTCISSVTTGWRNVVDVDVDGQVDDSSTDEKVLDVACRV